MKPILSNQKIEKILIVFCVIALIIILLITFFFNKANALSGETDVSGLDTVLMEKTFYPITVSDVLKIEAKAIHEGKQITSAGTCHSMGGHTLLTNGYRIITTKFMNRIIDINLTENTIIVETGATWAQIIKVLNQYKKTLITLQSYSTFSVGGSISVNAHGITSDQTLVDSVLGLEIVSNGKIYWTDRNNHYDLFRGSIGGYGLMGIITKAKLKITDNYKVTSHHKIYSIDEFTNIYPTYLDDQNIRVKYARVDPTTFDRVIMQYYQGDGESVVSNLPEEPRKISSMKQLFFKWIFASRLGKQMRHYIEYILGSSVDSVDYPNMGVNDIIFEDANPITYIWEPLIQVNQTHILNEYFIPLNRLTEFIDFIHKTLGTNNNLLNLTIRFVKKDNVTVLAYAKEDYCAMVFYFRINKNTESDKKLGKITQRLVKKVIEMGGTFYLPYRPFYSLDDIQEIYDWKKFCDIKNLYDPQNIYHNLWFDKFHTTLDHQ